MSALSDHIVNHVDIVQLISNYVNMRKTGTNYSWLCPFHNEKSPSFLVSPSKQIYKCFGCGKWGNAINFIMEIERIDYGDAVRQIAEQHNIPMDDFQSKWQSSPEYKSEKEKIKRIIKLAQIFFVAEIEKNNSVQEYLKDKRWISDNIIKQLGLWYAPSQSQIFFSYFSTHGFDARDLIDAGLAKKKEWGNDIYAFFRDRLIVPIRDQLGNVIAFGARALQIGQEPKYLNSSESIIYDKSSTLYGIDRLKSGVKEHKAIIVVEGYFDAIALQQWWYDIGLATCGTSLTSQHITTIKRYTDTVYLLFDNDNAWVTATVRWLHIAYAQWIYPKIIQFHNHKEHIKDIDDLVRNNPNAHTDIQSLIQSAQDGFDWSLHHFADQYDQLSPVAKDRAIQDIFSLIQSVESINIQNDFLQKMDEKLLKRQWESEKMYKVYIAQKKKTWPRKNIKIEISDTQKKTTEERRIHRLWTLLENGFWERLWINKEWILLLQSFVQLTKIQKPDNIIYKEIELEREQEFSVLPEWFTDSQATDLIKKILWPLIAEIQRTSIKQAPNESKLAILESAKKLR